MQRDQRIQNIGKNVVVNFPNETRPRYYDGKIIGHIRGNKYTIHFKDGIADVFLIPEKRGVQWFMGRGDWGKYRNKRPYP